MSQERKLACRCDLDGKSSLFSIVWSLIELADEFQVDCGQRRKGGIRVCLVEAGLY